MHIPCNRYCRITTPGISLRLLGSIWSVILLSACHTLEPKTKWAIVDSNKILVAVRDAVQQQNPYPEHLQITSSSRINAEPLQKALQEAEHAALLACIETEMAEQTSAPTDPSDMEPSLPAPMGQPVRSEESRWFTPVITDNDHRYSPARRRAVSEMGGRTPCAKLAKMDPDVIALQTQLTDLEQLRQARMAFDTKISNMVKQSTAPLIAAYAHGQFDLIINAHGSILYNENNRLLDVTPEVIDYLKKNPPHLVIE